MGRVKVRLGLLGGTFDPPHYGHLLMADTARAQLGLDRVLFAPAGQPPHKPDRPISPIEQRLALVRAAIADELAFELSRIDVDRPGPHYTVDALAWLSQAHPAASWYLIIGSDSLADLPGWRQPERIVQMARLAVMPRPGSMKIGAQEWTTELDIEWLQGPSLDISSTELRRRVSLGLPLRYLMPPAVADYIRQHKLYEGLV